MEISRRLVRLAVLLFAGFCVLRLSDTSASGQITPNPLRSLVSQMWSPYPSCIHMRGVDGNGTAFSLDLRRPYMSPCLTGTYMYEAAGQTFSTGYRSVTVSVTLDGGTWNVQTNWGGYQANQGQLNWGGSSSRPGDWSLLVDGGTSQYGGGGVLEWVDGSGTVAQYNGFMQISSVEYDWWRWDDMVPFTIWGITFAFAVDLGQWMLITVCVLLGRAPIEMGT